MFYNNYKDSLSFIPNAYNTSHIFFKLVPGEKSRSLAYFLADSIRSVVLNGGEFSSLAETFSDDPGSKMNGGELGFVGRGTFVPTFEQAAYNLDIMGISPVVESDFGFHIIQLLGKLGDKINTRHILISPKVSFEDEENNPLSHFWLGEISLIENDLSKSKDHFMELISSYPNHYRVPLAHKKIGDIYLKSNDVQSAKDKYNFVVREYPNNSASSLALQLLKNME